MDNEVKYSCRKTSSQKTRAFMKIVVDTLNTTGALDKVDTGALSLLEGSFDTFVKCCDVLERDGMFYKDRFNAPRTHPALNERHKAMGQALNVMKELGLTIKSRSRMPDTDIVTEEQSSLEQFFDRRIKE